MEKILRKSKNSNMTASSGKKVFRCDMCGKSLSNQKKLTEHIAAIHEGKKPFRCDICSYRFSQKTIMKKHVETVHEGKSHSNGKFVISAVLKRIT